MLFQFCFCYVRIITYLRVKETKTVNEFDSYYEMERSLPISELRRRKHGKDKLLSTNSFCLIITYLRVKETKTHNR